MFQHEDRIEKATSFPKPVLLFKGEGSSSFLHDIIDILGEDFPNALVQTLPGGHAPHVVSMEQFMEMFVRFLQEPS